VKAVLSILLGLMLVTSTLVGIAYATPIVRPADGSDNNCALVPPTDPNGTTLGCHGAGQHDHDPPAHCVDGRIGPDTNCVCEGGITPHSLETSDIHADGCVRT